MVVPSTSSRYHRRHGLRNRYQDSRRMVGRDNFLMTLRIDARIQELKGFDHLSETMCVVRNQGHVIGLGFLLCIFPLEYGLTEPD